MLTDLNKSLTETQPTNCSSPGSNVAERIGIAKSHILVSSLYNKMRVEVLLHVIKNKMRNVEGVN